MNRYRPDLLARGLAAWRRHPFGAACLLAVFWTSPPCQADITIDGVLDEPEWREAQVFDQFVTTEPLTTEPARYRTEVRVLTDEDGMYFGFSNYQPASVHRVNRRFPRDTDIQADRNIVAIDFDGSGLSGYDFTVGMAASRQDGIFRPAGYSSDWDGDWFAQTSQTEDYWYAEVHVPWTVAPMSRAPDKTKTMKMYFSRVVYDESLRFAYPEASFVRPTFLQEWAPVSVRQYPASTLDFFPYLAYGNDLENSDDEWKVGLDMVWRPDSNTQVTATVNPDFGQVESDDLVVNFSAIETFFSEKRPFFTENQALFTNNVPNGDRLVHTRRIGAASDAGDESVTDILAAAKLSRFGDGIDYGLFAVSEDDTRLSEGRDYVTTRLQGRRSGLTLGHSLTWVDRPTLDREALVNAVDLDWSQSASTRWRGQLTVSDIEQAGESDSDLLAWGSVFFAPSDIWQYESIATYYGEEFDMNDMGFMARNDLAEWLHRLRRDTLEYGADSRFRSSYLEAQAVYSANAEGDRLLPWASLKGNWILKSTEVLDVEAGVQAAGIDDLISRGNGDVKLPVQNWLELSYQNPRGGDFTYQAELEFRNEGTDKWSGAVEFEPQFYATDRFTIGGELEYKHYQEWLLWDSASQQLATFEADRYEADLRIDWYPSTRQEVRLKFQWIGIQADAISGFDIGGSGHLRPSGRPVEDFALSRTALQLRYRFEIEPLSDIFLVYSRGGLFEDDDTSAGIWDLLRDGWDSVGAEQIIFKIRYRI